MPSILISGSDFFKVGHLRHVGRVSLKNSTENELLNGESQAQSNTWWREVVTKAATKNNKYNQVELLFF